MTVEAPEKVIKNLVATQGPLGQVIDKMDELREKKRRLEAQAKEVEAEYKEIEEIVLERLAAEGCDKATGKKATASISTSVVGNLVDWDAFTKYVKKTGYFHLFQRRLSDPAIRELLDSKGKVPGVEPFVKKRLNLRSL